MMARWILLSALLLSLCDAGKGGIGKGNTPTWASRLSLSATAPTPGGGKGGSKGFDGTSSNSKDFPSMPGVVPVGTVAPPLRVLQRGDPLSRASTAGAEPKPIQQAPKEVVPTTTGVKKAAASYLSVDPEAGAPKKNVGVPRVLPRGQPLPLGVDAPASGRPVAPPSDVLPPGELASRWVGALLAIENNRWTSEKGTTRKVLDELAREEIV